MAQSKPRTDRAVGHIVPWLDHATVLRASYTRQCFAPHSHPTFVVALITSGTLTFECRGETWTAPQGAVCHIDPDAVQTGEGATEAGWSYWSAYIPTTVFEMVCDGKAIGAGAHCFDACVSQDSVAREAASRFFAAVQRDDEPLGAMEQALDCLSVLARRFREPAEQRRFEPEPRLVSMAKDYLAEHFAERVRLDDVAAIAGITSFHLTRLFKASTGLSLHAWLVQLRAERARAMLLGGATAVDTALACGFSDQSHLARWLRRQFGMTSREIQAMSRVVGRATDRNQRMLVR